MKINKYWPVFILTVLMFFSCDRNKVYDESIPIKDQIWQREEHAIFKVNIQDSINPHNLYVNVRNAGDYEFANVFLFITVTSPTGHTNKDTFNCILADDKGKWYGSGYGDLFDNRVLYKANILFPDTGIYIFDIEQAMRKDTLENISDIGIRIERKTH